jgi:hypothetical protein
MLNSNLKDFVLRNICHVPGWHGNRKIVVLESDDWGSLRMPSREVYENLVKKGIPVHNLSYNRVDSLASEEDLSKLFEVLLSVKDKNGKPAVITANTIVANPDFEKIKQADYQAYFYEPFTETLKRYAKHQHSFDFWKEGIQYGIFRPQFHGREHLNVKRWLRALQQNIGDVRLAFDYRMFDLSTSLVIGENSFMDTLNLEDILEIEDQKISLSEGLDLFEKIFGYRSITFIPPVYIWSNELDRHLYHGGIKAYQGGWFQHVPVPGLRHQFKKKVHYTGQRNKLGQLYLVRNAYFEPSDNPGFDWNGDVMKRAAISFSWGKPLIISTHRLNYIGFIDPMNSERNLSLLKNMLHELLEKWPDIEFMSSDQLVNLINKKNESNFNQ